MEVSRIFPIPVSGDIITPSFWHWFFIFVSLFFLFLGRCLWLFMKVLLSLASSVWIWSCSMLMHNSMLICLTIWMWGMGCSVAYMASVRPFTAPMKFYNCDSWTLVSICCAWMVVSSTFMCWGLHKRQRGCIWCFAIHTKPWEGFVHASNFVYYRGDALVLGGTVKPHLSHWRAPLLVTDFSHSTEPPLLETASLSAVLPVLQWVPDGLKASSHSLFTSTRLLWFLPASVLSNTFSILKSLPEGS